MPIWSALRQNIPVVMTWYDLPTALQVGGVEYSIRTDFRDVLNVLIAMNDPELDEETKMVVLLKVIYPGWHQIPDECMEEALKKACDFIDCGFKDDGKGGPRVIDWKEDANIIIPAINATAHKEVRAEKYLHWWTFMGYFSEIRESLLSTVIGIRLKKKTGKKLDQWEKDFYEENKNLVDMRTDETEEMKREKEAILKWLS